MTVTEIVHELIFVVAFGGNMLLNMGPGADGTIHPIFVDRLRGVGDWLRVNGEAVYQTNVWKVCQNETNLVYYTRREHSLFAHLIAWPQDNEIYLSCPVPTKTTKIRMLGWNKTFLEFDLADNSVFNGINVKLPTLTPNLVPCQHAWVLELTNLGNL